MKGTKVLLYFFSKNVLKHNCTYLFEMRENYKYSLKFGQFALKTC
jgi:hypothetical protein